MDWPENIELGAELGSGGMGNVYAVVVDGVDYALKVLRPYTTSGTAERRFSNEIDVLQMCRGPFVLDILTSGKLRNGRPAFIAEMCAYNMYEATAGGGAVLDPQIILMRAHQFRQLLVALERVHHVGVVHRDVKPANVLVTEHGDIRLADFGVAKHPNPLLDVQATKPLGTPLYHPPETETGLQPMTAAGDLYSAAATWCAIMLDTSVRALKEDKTHRSKLLNRLPAPFTRVIAKATALDPELRFKTASEMIGAFDVDLAAFEEKVSRECA